jgi:signal transduction histidine kinase
MYFVAQKNLNNNGFRNNTTEESQLSGVNGNDDVNMLPDNLGKVAHDIRGAINIIYGYTQMMLDEATGQITPEQRNALNDILGSVTQLTVLTDKLVERTGIESPEK